MSKLLEQVLHLLHEVGVGVVLRLLLLRWRSHLTSSWLHPCLQLGCSDISQDHGYLSWQLCLFLSTGPPVVEQDQSCTEERLVFSVSGFQQLLLSHHRLSLLSDASAQTYT